MRNSVEKRARAMRRKHLWNTRWKKTLSVFASVTVFCVTYMLILPAITESTGVYCGFEEHHHGDACYTDELVCGMEEGEVLSEGEEVLTDEGHSHTDACYSGETTLVCGLEERPAQTEIQVVETIPAWIDVDEEGNEILIPAVTEEVEVVVDEGHTHTDACYGTETVLVCGLEEHEPVYETTEPVVHHHTDACYTRVFDCDQPEHVHEELCYSDRGADVETALDWEETLPHHEEMTGVLARDVVLVAESQMGYRESTENFDVEEGTRKGYTRYGAMQGTPYANWSASFVQFCLHYAGMHTGVVNGDPDVQIFAENLSEQENYFLLDSYNLAEGDIVYLDMDADPDRLPDHMGIVAEREFHLVDDPNGGENPVENTVRFALIEGDSRDLVEKNWYDFDDERIVAVTLLPREEAEETVEESFEEEEAVEEETAEEGTGEEAADEEVTAGSEAADAEGDAASEENAADGGAGEEADGKDEEGVPEETDPEKDAEKEKSEENTGNDKSEEKKTDAGNTGKEIAGKTAENALPAVVELASVTETGVRINFSAAAEAFPESVKDPYLAVEEITDDHADFSEYEAEAKNQVEDDFHVYKGARFFDISIMDGDGEKVVLNDTSSARIEIICSEELAAVLAPPAAGLETGLESTDEEAAEESEGTAEEGISEDSVMEEAAQDDSVSEDGAVDEFVPDEGVLDEEVLEEVILEEGALEESTPEEVVLEEDVQEGSMEEPILEENVQNEAASEEDIQDDDTFEEDFQNEDADVESVPAEPVMLADAIPESEGRVDLEESGMTVLHFAENGTEQLSGMVEMDTDNQPAIYFETPGFSVFAVVETETLTTRVITAEGEDFTISVTYGPEAEIPTGSVLTAEEIPADSLVYADMLAQAEENVLGEEPGRRKLDDARFFRLAILDTENEPVEPAVPVEVSFEYDKPITVTAGEELYMVSFQDDVLSTLKNALADDSADSAEDGSADNAAASNGTSGEDIIAAENSSSDAAEGGSETAAVNTGVVSEGGIGVTSEASEGSSNVSGEETTSGSDTQTGDAAAEAVSLESISFQQDSLSVAGTFINRELSTSFLSADGNTYKVTVSYFEDAEIPEGATLSLTEYDEDSEEYAQIKELHKPLQLFIPEGGAEDDPEEESVEDESEEGKSEEDEFFAAQIEAAVQDMLAVQENAFQVMSSNGDVTGEDFIFKSEDELREMVRESLANKRAAALANREDTLALLDITILDEEGNEVEPKAPVEVRIVMEEIPGDASGLDLKNTLQVEHYVEGEDGLESEIVVSPDAAKGEIWVTEEDVVTATFTTESFSFYTLAWNQHDDYLDLDVMRTVVYYGFMISGKFREFGPMSWVKPHYAEENTTGGGALLDGKHHVYELNKNGWVTGVAAYSAYRFDKAVVQQDGYNGGKRFEIANERTYTKADGTQVTYNGPVIIGNETDGYTVLLKDGSTYKLGNADQIQVLYDSPYGEGMDYNYAKTSTTDKPVHGGDTYGLNEDGDPEGLGVPEHTKTLSENQSSGRNDNTYRLSLTATGRKKETKDNTKADIILITDYSGSMGKNPIINGTYNTNGSGMLQQAVDEGLLPPLKELDERFGKGTVEISHISFSTMAEIKSQNVPATDFGIWAVGSGATNYEDAFNKLSQIKTRADATTYVIFITDGNPTVRNSKGEINQWDGESWLYAHGYCSDEYFWTFRDNKWQWVRVGDIEKDHSLNWYNNGYYYGSGNEATGSMRDCYNVTIPYVQQLVQNNVNFSVIATKTGATYASQMVDVGNAAKAGSSSYYYAGNTQALEDAFSDILSAMEEELSYKFVSIDDEMSAVAETILVQTPEDFEYFKYPSHIHFVNNMEDKTPDTHTNALAVDEEGNSLDQNGIKCSESGLDQAKRGDFRWAEAPRAVYTEATDEKKGSVSWPLNTAEVTNETYEVTFTVYPNQYGWDMITTLANHWNDPDFDWASVSAEKVTNDDGSVDIYEIIYNEETDTYVKSGKKLLSTDANGNVKVASNDSASLTYKTVRHTTTEVDGVIQEDTTEEGPFKAEYASPFMSVDPSSFKIRKIWKDTLVPRWPIDTVDLKIWYVSKGDVKVEGTDYWMDSDTGDYTDKSEIAYVDAGGTTWYWAAKAEDLTLSQSGDLMGYINIHEPNENLGDANGYGASKVTVSSFNYMKSNGMIDSENYRINASGQRLKNANGNLIQYFAYWEADTNIAPGLVATSISPDPLPGAKGHYYALREEDTNTNSANQFQQHFELTSNVVRPMKRDGQMETEGSMLRGTNERKGELAVTKMVLTQDRHEIHPDVPFQVTVTLTDSDGNTLMQSEVTGNDENGQPIITQKARTDIEYVVYDAEGNVVANPTTVSSSKKGSGYTVGLTKDQIDAGASTSQYHVAVDVDEASGKHKLVYNTLYADWTVVLVNLPVGTKWEVQETYNGNSNASRGYQFEGYTLPDERRGSATLHPQPHFIADLSHYSGGTVKYATDGSLIETDLVKITDFDHADGIKDVNNRSIADANGAAAYPISGFINADAEELVDVHNIRTADELEIKKVDEKSGAALSGAKFVIESARPETVWRIHEENGIKTWVETYVFDSNAADPDSPKMTNVMGPAHYPAAVHIHGDDRYVVRGDVMGVLYAKPRSEWTDPYTPIPLDKDGNKITDIAWVTVPAGTTLDGLTSGVHYINQEGVNYILRPSTETAGAYEKIVDTTQTHVYYYVESGADGLLYDTDPNHQEKVAELPIIAGDSTTYKMYEIKAPNGYMTLLEQMNSNDETPKYTWDDAAIEIFVTSNRSSAGVPYLTWKDPRTGVNTQVDGVWNSDNKHWGFAFSITDKRVPSNLELKKVQSGTQSTMSNIHFSLFKSVAEGTEGAAFIYYNTNQSIRNYKNVLNPERDVVSVAEYSQLKSKTHSSGNYIDADGYLVDSSGTRVQHNDKDVLYQPNRFIQGSEAGKMYLLPAVNEDEETLLGLETNANGRIDFGILDPGTYWLYEQTPDGYVEALPTKIVVTASEVKYKNDAVNGGAEANAVSTENEDGTMTYEMVLTNTPKDLTLPNTGGIGTGWFTLLGMLMILGSILSLGMLRMRRRRA